MDRGPFDRVSLEWVAVQISVEIYGLCDTAVKYTKSDMSTLPYPVEDEMLSNERKMSLRDREECDR